MKIKFLSLLLIILVQVIFLPLPKAYGATTTVSLGTADSFAVLAGASVVDANLSVISGDIGLSPASGSFIGVKCSELTGTLYDDDGAYTGAGGGSTLCRSTNPGLLTQAQNDLTTAYTDASNRTPATTLPGGDNQLGGQTLTSGVYTFGHASSANIVGTVTLDAQNDPTAVFIFKASSDFITSSSSVVNLVNGAQACNVFWQVSTSATFGTSSNVAGTVMADQSITDNGGSTINGRFLARIATVTINNTHITKPTCLSPTPTPTPTPTPSSSPGPSGSSSSSSTSSSGSSVCTSPAITTVPTIIAARRVSPTSIFVNWGPDAGLNNFIIQYGFQNGNFQFNTNVSGFSTTINDLPPNQPIWIEAAATNNCAVGSYGPAVLVGGTALTNSPGFPNTGNPLLPNTGIGPDSNNSPWKIIASLGIAVLILASFTVVFKKRAILL